MRLTAKMPLKLANKIYKIVLKYDTFEQATYDSYLIAALIQATENKKEIIEYIDDITGKGSLNQHFKNLYNKMRTFTSEQIQGILADSLYPITVVDTNKSFQYYPMLDVTRFANKVYQGNLADNPDLKNMIMTNSKTCKFLSMDFEISDGDLLLDIYDVSFLSSSISIILEDGKYYPISKEDFDSSYTNELDKNLIAKYAGQIKYENTGGNLSILHNQVITSLVNTRDFYIDIDGNHCSIMDEYVKKTIVMKVFDLYFYQEILIKYNKENINTCESAIKQLLSSRAINEFDIKSLVHILDYVSEEVVQSVVIYMLSRQDLDEIAEVGLKLIKSGLKKGWDKNTLESIKKIVSENEYKYLYAVDSDLNFDVSDFLFIDNIDLTDQHKLLKEEYLSDQEKIREKAYNMLGKMTGDALREKMKKLPVKDKAYEKLNNFINKHIAHSEKSISSLSNQALMQKFEHIKDIYTNEYQIIKKRCNELFKNK